MAKQAIAWAEKEKDPEIVPVYNVANLIRSLENSDMHTPKEEDRMQEDIDLDTIVTKKHPKLPRPVSPQKKFHQSFL